MLRFDLAKCVWKQVYEVSGDVYRDVYRTKGERTKQGKRSFDVVPWNIYSEDEKFALSIANFHASSGLHPIKEDPSSFVRERAAILNQEGGVFLPCHVYPETKQRNLTPFNLSTSRWIVIYEAKELSDTDGRSPATPLGFYLDLSEAEKVVIGKGPMGSDGPIVGYDAIQTKDGFVFVPTKIHFCKSIRR